MKKLFLSITALVLLTSCKAVEPVDPPTAAEQNMADMMGITVEELRNQTPEEHMQMMMNH